jgi:hypothetical protein
MSNFAISIELSLAIPINTGQTEMTFRDEASKCFTDFGLKSLVTFQNGHAGNPSKLFRLRCFLSIGTRSSIAFCKLAYTLLNK